MTLTRVDACRGLPSSLVLRPRVSFVLLSCLSACGSPAAPSPPVVAVPPPPDTGPVTPGPDAGPRDAPPEPPRLRAPMNGAFTGSVWAAVPEGAPPRRPRFRWEPARGADRYRLQITDECSPPFEACAFERPAVDVETFEPTHQPAPLPVSERAPVGRRYFWRVRACNAVGCSPWSWPRYVNVARLPDDFDGDGFGDVLVGVPAADSDVSSDRGALYVFAGSAGGLSEEPSLTRIGEASGKLGASVAALGDVNADGFADALVGYSWQNGDEEATGRTSFVDNALLLLGSADGLGRPAPIAVDAIDASRLFAGTFLGTRHAYFRTVVARAGDVDADGDDDFVVAVVAQDSDAEYPGHVYGYLGAPDDPGRRPSFRLDNPEGALSHARNVDFGHALAGGDLDGDGRSDLVVGAPNQEGWRGVVHVYGDALASPRPRLRLIATPQTGADGFGGALATGRDFDGDGVVDLVVGAREHDAQAYNGGALFLFPGAADGLGVGRRRVNPDANDGNQVGLNAVLADVDGDGRGDLVAGAIGQGAGEEEFGVGAVLVTLDAAASDPDARLLRDPWAGERTFFGYATTIADVDGDGRDEVIAAGASSGRLVVFAGGVGGPTERPASRHSLPCQADREGCGFGLVMD